MSRYKAACLHLFASFVVLLFIFAFVNLVWYPGKLFQAASGSNIMLILLLVDMSLGPLVTLIVFDIKKSSLKFDMGCVLFVQLLFIVYGVWVIFSARPVYIAFVEDKFHLVTANEIEYTEQIISELPEYKNLPLWGPSIVGTKLPDNIENNEKILFAAMAGLGPQNFPEFYTKYENVKTQVIASALPADKILNIDAIQQQYLKQYTISREPEGINTEFLRFITKQNVFYIAINKKNADILDILQVTR